MNDDIKVGDLIINSVSMYIVLDVPAHLCCVELMYFRRGSSEPFVVTLPECYIKRKNWPGTFDITTY